MVYSWFGKGDRLSGMLPCRGWTSLKTPPPEVASKGLGFLQTPSFHRVEHAISAGRNILEIVPVDSIPESRVAFAPGPLTQT